MKVGVADIDDLVVDPDKETAKGSSSIGIGGPRGPRGSGGGGNNGGGSGGGGGDSREPADLDDPTEPNTQKSKLLTYFLLMAVLMTFGGVIAAYVVIATNKAVEWQPFHLPFQVWISTAILALSSVAYFVSERAVFRRDHQAAKRWLVITTALGATFISSQLVLWLELVSRGVYAYGNPYAGFFYILTALHAIHVFGGIIAISSLLLRFWFAPKTEKDAERRMTLSQVVGWYWHMMGVLWLVLVGLLGFWT